MSTIDEAREVKRRWYNLLEAGPSGFGLTHIGSDGWALKVNTIREPAGPVPATLDGVPLVVECVGKVVAAVGGVTGEPK